MRPKDGLPHASSHDLWQNPQWINGQPSTNSQSYTCQLVAVIVGMRWETQWCLYRCFTHSADGGLVRFPVQLCHQRQSKPLRLPAWGIPGQNVSSLCHLKWASDNWNSCLVSNSFQPFFSLWRCECIPVGAGGRVSVGRPITLLHVFAAVESSRGVSLPPGVAAVAPLCAKPACEL